MQPVPVQRVHAHQSPASLAGVGVPGVAEPLWPDELLELFCLRMSSQGMCVSRSLMQHDRRYGLEQLAFAHNMGDEVLRAMAVHLFRHFSQSRSGISPTH